MKNQIVKIIALCLCIFMGTNVFAQEQQNPQHPNSQAKPVAHGRPKDEYMQKLTEFQPKLNDLLAKAKENASGNPDFSTEANKLNDMVAAFKSKLDHFDNTPREQQNDYASSLKSDWTAIEAQYNKGVELGSKNRPNDEPEKGKESNKQIPPK
jgi:peptidoglycan hydrolase CwlO-like protein